LVLLVVSTSKASAAPDPSIAKANNAATMNADCRIGFPSGKSAQWLPDSYGVRLSAPKSGFAKPCALQATWRVALLPAIQGRRRAI
jgi:hypothetical protein